VWGGVEDLDMYRRLTLKWISTIGVRGFGLVSLRHRLTWTEYWILGSVTRMR